jgi:hypothetical protein
MKPLRVVSIVVGLALLGLGALWLMGGDRGATPRESAEVETTPRSDGPAGWRVAPGETVAIALAEVEGGGATVIDLVLGEPSVDDRALSGRILSLDSARPDRERPITGRIVDGSRRTARIEVPTKWLVADSYLVEIKTTEKSHFPLRRYKIEVR